MKSTDLVLSGRSVRRLLETAGREPSFSRNHADTGSHDPMLSGAVDDIKLDEFTRQYIETMLWSSTGDDEEPLDKTYGAEDLAPETLRRVKLDCLRFQQDNAADIETWDGRDSAYEQAGHDFWLTRVGSGAGFYDGDWEHEVGERLTAAAKKYGHIDPYVGDDGLIYLS